MTERVYFSDVLRQTLELQCEFGEQFVPHSLFNKMLYFDFQLFHCHTALKSRVTS